MTTTNRPNWPDNDPRWLRATYDELIRLEKAERRAHMIVNATFSSSVRRTSLIDQRRGGGQFVSSSIDDELTTTNSTESSSSSDEEPERERYP